MSSEIIVSRKSDGAPSLIYDEQREELGINSVNAAMKSTKSQSKIDDGLLQMPYPGPQFGKSPQILPSNVAIPLGLAQVFLGGSMVVCGSLALRFRSYLFYYGAGLWAGTIAGITGALVVMATKQGLRKPSWLCGGRKWQVHVIMAAAMLALTASVLLSIFSTLGLMQDTMHQVGVELGTPTKDEETFERRKSSGIAINAILLLLAMLEILLTFCSMGVALRVICRSPVQSLFTGDSAGGSQVTMHDILGSGPEYEARKDRLLRWLGHQRKNFLLSTTPTLTPQQQRPRPQPIHTIYRNHSPSLMSIPGPAYPHVPHLVALRPQPLPRPMAYPRQPGPVGPYGYPVLVPVPFCPLPVRRAATPAIESRPRRRTNPETGSVCTVSSKRSQQSSRAMRKKVKTEEITEEDIGKTYTGLDRTMAEDFISNSMQHY